MATAKNREQYVKAWESHAAEMGCMLLESGMTYDEYLALREQLRVWINKAADKAFPEEAAAA